MSKATYCLDGYLVTVETNENGKVTFYSETKQFSEQAWSKLHKKITEKLYKETKQ